MDKKYQKYRKYRNREITGEDIDMFREREREQKRKDDTPICDRHIDGA